MKYIFLIISCLFLKIAQGQEKFHSYEEYYLSYHDHSFWKVIEEPNQGYAFLGKKGLCGEEDGCRDYRGKLGPKSITVTTSTNNGFFQINQRAFDYQNAIPLNGQKNNSNEVPLHEITVHIGRKSKKHPDMICIEGYYMGSGRFRLTEVFLVLNPLGPKKQVQVFHLPSLHASCLAVRPEPDGSISYPRNRYFPDGDPSESTGLLLQYYRLKNGRSTPLNREIRLEFTKTGVPFEFSEVPIIANSVADNDRKNQNSTKKIEE